MTLYLLIAVTASACSLLLQNVTGVIMLRSVIQIRKFFAGRDALAALDTQVLVFHAVAFGAYLMTTGLLLIALLCLVLRVPNATEIWITSLDIVTVGSLISQLFLV